VAARCDVLSIHLVLGPETRKIVNAEVLSRLKPGSVVINTARGEIVDNAALTAAIRERHLRVGLDVFAEEPTQSAGEFVDPIVREAGVYGTHHIGASTDQAQEAIAAETVRIVQAFMETGKAPNAVN
ncbi:MAG TPA: NAD(P)-dependent oxidoreductase, partial [Vicinamibacterales bacterium]